MRRRDLMSVGATAVWPLAAHAQQLDDYVEGHKIVSVALNKFFSAAVAIAGVYAVLKVGIQSQPIKEQHEFDTRRRIQVHRPYV
jgi:hypothetical protein